MLKFPRIAKEIENENVHQIKELLGELLNNKRLGNKTRSMLTRLDDLVDRIL